MVLLQVGNQVFMIYPAMKINSAPHLEPIAQHFEAKSLWTITIDIQHNLFANS